MLRTNLSTRPFYNVRAVRLGIGLVAILAAGLTVFNAIKLWRLQSENRELGATVAQNEREAVDLREKARAIEGSLDRSRLASVDAAAREANELIDRRAFSWTELLNQFQATLPSDVRITSVQPQVDDDGRMLVAMTVRSRRLEDLDAFIDTLEKSGRFRDVLAMQDATDETDGALVSVLQAYYGGIAQPLAAVPPLPTSEPGKDGAGNRTPPAVAPGAKP